jgi:hypothetical protein
MMKCKRMWQQNVEPKVREPKAEPRLRFWKPLHTPHVSVERRYEDEI